MWNVWSDTSYKSYDLGGSGYPTSGWMVAGTGDFNGDGLGDILWMNQSAAQVGVWTMAVGSVTSMIGAPGLPSLSGLRAFVGDLDGNGVSDVIWTGTSGSSPVAVTWLMSSGNLAPTQQATRTLSGQTLVGLGDFARYSGAAPGGFNQVQQLWLSSSGQLSVQTSGQAINSPNPSTLPLGTLSAGMVVAGTGDFNGDGVDDVLIYNSSNGAVMIWGISGYHVAWSTTLNYVPTSQGWTIQGVADIDHDGVSDIVWRHTSGVISFWTITGSPTVVVNDYTTPMTVGTSPLFAGSLTLGPKAPQNTPTVFDEQNSCTRNPGFATYETWWGGSFYGSNGNTFLGDVDGDGKADLVAVGSNYVGLILSTGTSFGAYETAYSGVFSGPYGTMLGDVTGDGMADLVTLGSSSVSVLPATGGAGSAAFGSIQSWWPGFFYGGYGNMLGDIDGDGKADLVGLGSNQHRCPEVVQGEQLRFLRDRARQRVLRRPRAPSWVTSTATAEPISWPSSTWAVVVALATGASPPGNALFGANQTWYGASFYGSSFVAQLGDVDGDGRADLDVARRPREPSA